MGCVASTEHHNEESSLLIQERRINEMIEKQIQSQQQNEKTIFKILMLGTGESGKSTVFKQLRLLHQGGFSESERLQYSQIIWVDLIQSMKILITQARKLGIVLDCDDPNNPQLFKAKQMVLRVDPLKQIRADVAGGSEFLKDYVIKYSDQRQKRIKNNQQSDSDIGLINFNEFEATEINGNTTNSMDSYDEIQNLSDELQKVMSFQTEKYSKNSIAQAISLLYSSDRGISKVLAQKNRFQLESNVSYYFENVSKFAQPKYLCSNQDILMGRIKTTGITESIFNIDSFKFRVLDAGGQRSERKKWIHCFEGISTILFVVALSEYDQNLFEDERVNRMHESIILFDSLCNSKWFANTPFILFLNKIDILKAKLKTSPINLYFPNYKGNPQNADEVIAFFTDIFLKLNRTKKQIYVHTTCATDTSTMEFVLAAVTDVVVQQNLQSSGII